MDHPANKVYFLRILHIHPIRFHSYLQGKRSGQKFLSTTASDHFPAHFEDTSIRANTIVEGNGLLRAFSALYAPFKYSQNFKIVCPSGITQRR